MEEMAKLEQNRAMLDAVRTLTGIVDHVSSFEPVRKADLRRGDQLLIATVNSLYSISVLDDGAYLIRGGWFDRQGASPALVSIAGCTWGGSVIKTDIVAACGLYLEFGNRLVTSRIRAIRLVRDEASPGEDEAPTRMDESVLSRCGIRWSDGKAS